MANHDTYHERMARLALAYAAAHAAAEAAMRESDAAYREVCEAYAERAEWASDIESDPVADAVDRAQVREEYDFDCKAAEVKAEAAKAAHLAARVAEWAALSELLAAAARE